MGKHQRKKAHKSPKLKSIQTEQRSSPIHKADSANLESRVGEWRLKREKLLFTFELVVIFIGVVLGAATIFHSSSALLAGGAAAAIWGTIRKLRKHLLAPTKPEAPLTNAVVLVLQQTDERLELNASRQIDKEHRHQMQP